VSLPLGRTPFASEDIVSEPKDGDMSHYVIDHSKTEKYIPDFSKTVEAKDEEKKSILIVEDNVEVANFIKDVLSDDYNILMAENGLAGYQCAITKHPNLIISDMMMPEMDGLELCAKLKADIRTSHIPFVLLSARTSLVHKYDGLESGADDYLFKPFNVKELLLKCKNIINTHNKLKEKFVNSNIFQPSELPVNSIDEAMMNKAFQLVKDNIANEFFSVDEFSSGLGVS
jgi:DNA-binding response OmpR family regulator